MPDQREEPQTWTILRFLLLPAGREGNAPQFADRGDKVKLERNPPPGVPPGPSEDGDPF